MNPKSFNIIKNLKIYSNINFCLKNSNFNNNILFFKSFTSAEKIKPDMNLIKLLRRDTSKFLIKL